MYIIVRVSDNVIVGNANNPVNVHEASRRGSISVGGGDAAIPDVTANGGTATGGNVLNLTGNVGQPQDGDSGGAGGAAIIGVTGLSYGQGGNGGNGGFPANTPGDNGGTGAVAFYYT